MSVLVKKLKFYLFIFCIYLIMPAIAQKKQITPTPVKYQVGPEVQWYPAGWIIGPVANYFITPKHLINVRAAINIANRHNWSGLNDDEKGTGFGGSLGYSYLFTPGKRTFFIGARGDLWSTKINWKNKIGTPQQTSGSTRIIVFQPTVELGYMIKLDPSKWSLLCSVGGGREINIKTTGKEVGQGGIWLLGISTFYSF